MSRRLLSALLTAVLAAGIFFIPTPDSAYACSCADLSAAEAYEYASVVFSGTAVSKDSSGGNTFDVDRVWKGSLPDGYVYSGFFGMCGTEFELGERYLVYTHNVEGVEHTGLCSGNKLLAEAGEDIAVLNGLVAPEGTRDFIQWLLYGAAAMALIATFTLVYRIRNIRKSQ